MNATFANHRGVDADEPHALFGKVECSCLRGEAQHARRGLLQLLSSWSDPYRTKIPNGWLNWLAPEPCVVPKVTPLGEPARSLKTLTKTRSVSPGPPQTPNYTLPTPRYQQAFHLHGITHW